METIWYVIFWSLVGGVVSLGLGIALVSAAPLRSKVIRYALPFGAGALLATAFTNTLPEALESGLDAHTVLMYTLIGFLAFFVLERLAGWLHNHHDHARKTSQSSMVVIGDTLHNSIDGVAIGIAFLVDIPTGIVTSIAVAAHELPQEVGDFGILLSRGVRASRVIIINILSGLATVAAATVTFTLGSGNDWQLGYPLALAAGFFIYIAASDIIPEIHENPKRLANIQSAVLLIGVVTISLVSQLAPHDHGEEADEHGKEPSSSLTIDEHDE